jgi:hypothetical protein
VGGHPGLHVDRRHRVGHDIVQFTGDPQALLVDPPPGVLLGARLDRRDIRPPVGDRDAAEAGDGHLGGDQVEPAAEHPERVVGGRRRH